MHYSQSDPPKNDQSDRLYSTKEAAIKLGVSPDTLYCWKSLNRYNLPVVKVGRLNKYRHSDLMRFLAERTINQL